MSFTGHLALAAKDAASRRIVHHFGRKQCARPEHAIFVAASEIKGNPIDNSWASVKSGNLKSPKLEA